MKLSGDKNSNRAIADLVRAKLSVAPNGIPEELRARQQWVCWRYEKRGSGKPTKIPYHPNNSAASSTDPATWSSFGEVIEAIGFDGIGFVFSEDDPYVGIDLDDAIAEDGMLKPWAQKLVDRMNTYTERSPGGYGVKLWCKGEYPGIETGKKKPYKDGSVEMYHKGRYFCVTGQVYPDTNREITEQQSGIDGFYTHILNPKPQPQPSPKPRTDAIDRCMRYIEKCPDAVSGESGHDKTLRAACECFRFGLSDGDTWRVMHWFNATKCSPQWTERELTHKIDDAKGKVCAAGDFGKHSESLVEPRVPLAPPPAQTTSLRARIQETIDGKRRNETWPWPVLTSTARALVPGSLTLLCGMGGSTKSLLMSQACLYWLSAGIPFAVFHLEEDRELHLTRALAQLDRNSSLTREEWQQGNPRETMAAYERHRSTLDALSQSMWDAPGSDVAICDVDSWVQQRAEEGRRIIVVDPITVADAGREPWNADRRFVLNSKRYVRNSGASFVVVTHPRSDDPKQGKRMDNHAGGQAYNRFTSCVLHLRACNDETVAIAKKSSFGTEFTHEEINRRLCIHKARNGLGTGWDIGMWFDATSLRFTERGLIRDD